MQRVQLDGLEQQIARPIDAGRFQGDVGIEARAADRGWRVGEIVDGTQQGNPVQPGQDEIEQHRIGMQVLDFLQRILAVVLHREDFDVRVDLEKAAQLLRKLYIRIHDCKPRFIHNNHAY